jgi:hypothetical protein
MMCDPLLPEAFPRRAAAGQQGDHGFHHINEVTESGSSVDGRKFVEVQFGWGCFVGSVWCAGHEWASFCFADERSVAAAWLWPQCCETHPRVLSGTEGKSGRSIIEQAKRQTQGDHAMSGNHIMPHADATELTADQLDAVCGGIKFAGGKAPVSGDVTLLTYGGAVPTSTILGQIAHLPVI